MAKVSVSKWWKATEIPLVETEWRNIKLYCSDNEDCWNWTQCVYFIRLAPPYMIAYGDGDLNSPLIYVGSGALKQRWREHRDWMRELGHWLPGGRYEIWALNHPLYVEIESDALFYFRNICHRLPLVNAKGGGKNQTHSYDDGFTQVYDSDRRHWWALRPIRKELKDAFEKGTLPAESE
jgi:hypothetical protein